MLGSSFDSSHRIEINRKATRVGTFEVCVSTHASLRMFIMQVLASQLPFLANRNAELAVLPLLWPVNCIKIGGHVALLSGPTVYSLYCAVANTLSKPSKWPPLATSTNQLMHCIAVDHSLSNKTT